MRPRRVVEARVLKQRVSELEERLDEAGAAGFFESSSASFRGFLQTAARVAAADCTVLLRGESGTGKNVMAQWVRAHSPREGAPFVSVNCPALSTELMSSTLFGHKKGTFTGADADAVGKVQKAEGGTLFLDEVGDLAPDAQVRLLRFLNDWSYERLGEPKERTADVRLIAATNRPLEEEVRAGRFREDLFFRLNVVTLTLPPLRERLEDALPLAQHYLRFFARRRSQEPCELSPEAEQAILAHGWPGNLRELCNAVERATILAQSRVIQPHDSGHPERGGACLAPLGRGGRARCRRLAGRAGARAHRARGRAGAHAGGRRAYARHRRAHATAQAQALRPRVSRGASGR